METRSFRGADVAGGMLIGALVGFVIVGLIGGLIVFQSVRSTRAARAGWNLVPVIVANQDLAAGDMITYEVISQRPIPEQFRTASSVYPDSSQNAVGKRLRHPLKTGDLLLWTHIEDGDDEREKERPGVAGDPPQDAEPSHPGF